MHQTKKGNQWYFGMKAHIGVDAESGLAHSLATTAANAADVTQACVLLHGDETEAWGDAGYQGVDKRPENRGCDVAWQVAMKPGKRRLLDRDGAEAAAEKRKASVRAKVEHPFLYVKRRFGYGKVRYRGLAKNTQRIALLLGFSKSAHRWPLRDRITRGPWAARGREPDTSKRLPDGSDRFSGRASQHFIAPIGLRTGSSNRNRSRSSQDGGCSDLP